MPQKRIADHIRTCHKNITPRKRKKYCQIAIRVRKNYIKPAKGQRKLSFVSSPADDTDDLAPIFGETPLTPANDSIFRTKMMNPGKKGSTRSMTCFAEDDPKLVDFRKYLMSVEGRQKSLKTAREISADISKLLYHCNPSKLTWTSLTNRVSLLTFFEKLTALEVGAEGRLTKMERLGDAFRYMRFCLHSQPNPNSQAQLGDIDAAELSLSQWKTVLRREKKRLNMTRLERDSNQLPSFDTVSEVVDSKKLERTFNRIVEEKREGNEVGEEDLQLAMAAVAIPLMFQSSSRPGAVANMTIDEFERGSLADDLFIVSVAEHKAGIKGTAKLMFPPTLLERANQYLQYIRPALVGNENIPSFFVLPGPRQIYKISNLSRFLGTKLGVNVPSATSVRKIGTTAVARACSKEELSLISRQMNHDRVTSENYYECIRSDSDAAIMFKTIEELRHGKGGGSSPSHATAKTALASAPATSNITVSFIMCIHIFVKLLHFYCTTGKDQQEMDGGGE